MQGDTTARHWPKEISRHVWRTLRWRRWGCVVRSLRPCLQIVVGSGSQLEWEVGILFHILGLRCHNYYYLPDFIDFVPCVEGCMPQSVHVLLLSCQNEFPLSQQQQQPRDMPLWRRGAQCKCQRWEGAGSCRGWGVQAEPLAGCSAHPPFWPSAPPAGG